MDESQKKPLSGSAFIGAVLIGALLLTAFIPARWFGVKQNVSTTYTPIDFSTIKPAEEVLKESDGDNNGTVTWRELFEANLPEGEVLTLDRSTPDPEIQEMIDDPNNLTTSFAKNLMVSSAYIKNNNITDPEAQKRILEGITQEEIGKAVSRSYAIKDIKLGKTESRESVRVYGNKMATILKKIVTKQDLEKDLPGVIEYLETENEDWVIPMQKTAARMDKIVTEVLAVEVPPTASLYHLSALNQLVIYRDITSNLSKIATDPVRASISLQKYIPETIKTIGIFITLKEYVSVQQVSFTKEEPGYVFIEGYKLK